MGNFVFCLQPVEDRVLIVDGDFHAIKLPKEFVKVPKSSQDGKIIPDVIIVDEAFHAINLYKSLLEYS